MKNHGFISFSKKFVPNAFLKNLRRDCPFLGKNCPVWEKNKITFTTKAHQET